jgi:hypothetical protein
MKKFLIVVLFAVAGFVFYNFSNPVSEVKKLNSEEGVVIPDSIKVIIDKSCYVCHNSESKNMKGKLKLKFDSFEKLSTFKAVGKLGKIQEELNKGKMPPKKFEEKHPEDALSSENKEKLLKWAKETADNLAGN